MSFLDSIKSRFDGHREEELEADFGRGLREGRYPEGVDDFEPLNNTGNFVAPGAEFTERTPYAPIVDDASGVMDSVSSDRGRSSNVSSGALGDPEEGVQVYERDENAPRRSSRPSGSSSSFRDRFQDRVAAANVAGWQDESLGRSKVAASPDVTVPPESVRRTPSPDVTSDELEAELRNRRREYEQERTERERGYGQDRAGATPLVPQADQDHAPAARSGASAQASSSASGSAGFGALPTMPTVVRVRTYDDVSEIARSVVARHQPVVLLMRGTSSETTKRVLDFSFGLCCGCGAEISELENRVYCMTPRGTSIGDREKSALRRQGILLRG